jgi:hypothetical protein
VRNAGHSRRLCFRSTRAKQHRATPCPRSGNGILDHEAGARLQAEPTGRKTQGGYFRPAPSPQSGDGALPTALPWVTAPSIDKIATIRPIGHDRCPWRASGRLTAG